MFSFPGSQATVGGCQTIPDAWQEVKPYRGSLSDGSSLALHAVKNTRLPLECHMPERKKYYGDIVVIKLFPGFLSLSRGQSCFSASAVALPLDYTSPNSYMCRVQGCFLRRLTLIRETDFDLGCKKMGFEWEKKKGTNIFCVLRTLWSLSRELQSRWRANFRP